MTMMNSLSLLRTSAISIVLLSAACARADMPQAEASTKTSTKASTTAAPGTGTTGNAHPVVAAAVPDAPSAAPTKELAPLEGSWMERMVLDNGEVAYVAVPLGAREKRPIIVGVHGAGDHADWSCSEWHAVVAHWAFVVCPQGVRHPTDKTAFVWGSAEAIAGQADRAVAAVRAKYTDHVAAGPLTYGGWSQGASLASQVVSSRPGVYDRAVLVEVGHTPLDPAAVAQGLASGGVKRAVISCSSTKCRDFAKGFEPAAKRRSMPAQINDVGNRGHWFDEPVFRTLGPKVAWLVSDEERYAGLGAAVEARFLTD